MEDFEKDYFDMAYGGEYERRNPYGKIVFYLREIRKMKPSGSLLDIGCAYGLFLAHARKYYHTTGCDISAHAIAEARRRLPDEDIFQADIETLSIDKTFDVITCFDILEHVEKLDKAFEKTRMLLKDGGILVLTVPVYDTFVGWIVGVLDRDETHIWKQSRNFWLEKLHTHGFKLIENIGLWRYYLVNRFYLFFGGKIWKNFSPALMLIGQKR